MRESKKPSFSYATGHSDFDRSEASTPLGFTRFCRAKLGCDVPVGSSRRGVWYQRLEEEMEVQGWTWNDMLAAVDYIQNHRIVIRRVEGVLYYVNRALKEGADAPDLQFEVAKALQTETNQDWVRRLSLAKGKALERVFYQYRDWKERTDEV